MRFPGELLAVLAGIGLWVFADGGWETAGKVLTFVGATLAVIHVLYLFVAVRMLRREQGDLAQLTSTPEGRTQLEQIERLGRDTRSRS